MNSTSAKPGLSFFKLPSDFERRTQWLRLLCREDLMERPHKNYTVCEEHFNTMDILQGKNRRQLKTNSLPSLRLPDSQKKDAETVTEVRSSVEICTQTEEYSTSSRFLSYDNKENIMLGLNICCVCLQENTELYPLESNKIAYQSLIDLLNTEVNSWTQVCEMCLKRLTEFSEFSHLVRRNNQFLTEILINSNNCDKLHIKDSIKNFLNGNIVKHETLTGNTTEESTNRELIVIDTIKSEIDWDVKTEIDDLPAAEAFDVPIIDSKDNDSCHRFKKKKCKNKSRERQLKPPKRKFVHVDPDKITVITLTKEEQLKMQQGEANKPSYLALPYKCLKCFKGYNFERKLKAHEEMYHKPNSQFSCDICTRTLSNGASLAIHLKKHQLVYQCNVCLVRFVEKPRAIDHYKTKHEGIQTEMPCQHCDRIFSNRSSLNGHLRNHHPQVERPQCDVCKKTFATKDSLQDHMMIHSGEKNFSCEICNKKFRLRQAVAVHMLSHSSLRSFYCAACDACFKSRGGLVHHLRTATAHADASLPKQHTCERCGRGFTTRSRLGSHMRMHLGLKSVRRNSKERGTRYVCHCCGKGFTALGSLSNHLLTHSGVRPFACPHCPARFAQRATLKAHCRRHNAK